MKKRTRSVYVKKKKKNYLLVLGVLASFLVIGLVLNYSKDISPKPQTAQAADIELDKSFWISQVVLLQKKTKDRQENIRFSVEFPRNWTMKVVNKPFSPQNVIRNCLEYNLKNQNNTAELQISLICQSWNPLYTKLPLQTTTVGVTNGGQILRYYDYATNQYVYIQPDKTDHVAEAIPLRYGEGEIDIVPVRVVFGYTGFDSETVLHTADMIVMSLLMRKE